jgi:predicted transporter
MNLILFTLAIGSISVVLNYPFFAYGLGIFIALIWAFLKKRVDFLDLLGASAFGPLIMGGVVVSIKILFNTQSYVLGATDSDITGFLFTAIIAIIYAIRLAWMKFGPKQKKPQK